MTAQQAKGQSDVSGFNFEHDFGGIQVSMTGPTIEDMNVEVRGPAGFIATIDWERAQSTALLFAEHTAPFMALALAVQMQYAAWSGLRGLVA